MHDVTEGGFLGALYELSEASNTGLEVDLSKVIFTEEAKKFVNFSRYPLTRP